MGLVWFDVTSSCFFQLVAVFVVGCLFLCTTGCKEECVNRGSTVSQLLVQSKITKMVMYGQQAIEYSLNFCLFVCLSYRESVVPETNSAPQANHTSQVYDVKHNDVCSISAHCIHCLGGVAPMWFVASFTHVDAVH